MISRSISMVLTALFFVAGCGAGGFQVPGEVANLVLPPEQEAQLASQVDQQLQQRLDLVEDPRIVQYVQQVGQRVARASADERGPVDVRFQVVDDPNTVNAFTSLGGNIYVYTGLLLAVEDEAQLASVLAHEVAHVANRDVAKLLTAQLGLSTLARAAVGTDPGAVEQIVTQVVGAGAIAAHTREQERDADALAVRYLAQAGYDPRAMIAMYETLGRLQQQNPGAVQQFFSTHPPMADRIAAIQQDIRRIGSPRGTVGREEYAAFLRDLRREQRIG